MAQFVGAMTWDQFRDLLPVLTFLAGLLASPITDGIKERRARKAAKADRAEEFTWKLMLDLQRAVFKHSGALQDIINESESGARASEELFATAWSAAVECDRLRV